MIPVYTLVQQNRLDCSESKHGPGSEEAVYDGERNLNWAWSAHYVGMHKVATRELTNALPLGYLECAHCRFFVDIQLSFGGGPGADGVETHLAVPAVWTRLATPGLVLLHGGQSLG